jgi:hypothetical protein
VSQPGDDLEDLFQAVTVDCHGEDDELGAFLQAFDEELTLPAEASVVGRPRPKASLPWRPPQVRDPAEAASPDVGGVRHPVVLGAAIGSWRCAKPPRSSTLSVLALTGGALSAVVVEEMVSEAHQGDTSSVGPVFLTAGFALFAAISVYVG